MRYLIVGGNFSNDLRDDGQRPSGYINKLASALEAEGAEVFVENGGPLTELTTIVFSKLLVDAVIWAPNVDNKEIKLVGKLKEKNPRIMLVTTKQNSERKYAPVDLVDRALKAKANLLLEFTDSDVGICASIIDPLGNKFLHKIPNVKIVAEILNKRLLFLNSMTRVGCIHFTEIHEPEMSMNCKPFIDIARGYADTFHDLIHTNNPSRFLGNASFRCEAGFPSMRVKEGIYVTRRNCDKRDLVPEKFVAVELNGKKVRYYGDHKPSVDTPIQRELYRHYPEINYMIHSHVYVDGAPMTEEVIPCGSMEEVAQIKNLVPAILARNFAINLRGHGSIIAGRFLVDMLYHEFIPRKMFERHEVCGA